MSGRWRLTSECSVGRDASIEAARCDNVSPSLGATELILIPPCGPALGVFIVDASAGERVPICDPVHGRADHISLSSARCTIYTKLSSDWRRASMPPTCGGASRVGSGQRRGQGQRCSPREPTAKTCGSAGKPFAIQGLGMECYTRPKSRRKLATRPRPRA